MPFALFYLVTPGYLQAMRIPVHSGRFIGERDDEHSPSVVVIDSSFARKHFPNQDPIGKHLNIGLLDIQPEIIGVVGHVEHWGLGSKESGNIQPQIYLPVWQVPDRFWPLLANGSQYVARTVSAPIGVVDGIRHAVEKVDSTAVLYEVRPMQEIVAGSVAKQRMAMYLLTAFSSLALLLSAVGIYGVISYLAGQRTHEIGIRVALGASRADVLRLVLGEGMRIALAGVGVGIVAALGLTRLLTQIIYGVGANDPITFAGVAILLTAVALLACYLPARRAMRVDPIVVLRYE
jgi:predicted permease